MAQLPIDLTDEFDSAFVDARAQEAAQQAIHSFDQEATSMMPLLGHQFHQHLGALAAGQRDWLREQLAGVPAAIPLAQHRLTLHVQEVRDALGLANEHMEDHAALRAQQAVGEVALQAQQAVAQAALRAARRRLQEMDAAVRLRQERVPGNMLDADFEAGRAAAEAIFRACAGDMANAVAGPIVHARDALNADMHQLEEDLRAHNQAMASHQQQADDDFAHTQFVDDVVDDVEEAGEGGAAFPGVGTPMGETGNLGAAKMAETTELEEGEQEPSAAAAAAAALPSPKPAAAAVAVEKEEEEEKEDAVETKLKAAATAAAQEKGTTPEEEEEEEAEVALASVPTATSATVKETPAAALAPVLAAEAAAAAGKDVPADRRQGLTVRFALPTGA